MAEEKSPSRFLFASYRLRSGMENKMKVVMLGADRNVKGGVSAMVNNLYEAGISQKVNLVYIGTMVDGSSIGKLFKDRKSVV